MAATLVKNADRMMSSASALGSGIELSFVDGCSGVIPFADLPEVAAGGGVMEIELPNPYEMVIVMNSGDRSEIPWDYARDYCNPSYRPRIEAIARVANENLGRRIRQCRKDAGLTQIDLADRAEIGRATLIRIEKGEHSPRHKTLSAIAQFLGVEFRELVTREME
jgi:DNA-binding XRE family transcriptional regulator